MVHSLRVARVVEETSDAKSFVLDVPPALADRFRYRAGQFVTLEVPCEGGARLRRCYSLASCPDLAEPHRVTVKRVRGGRVSGLLVDRVRAGDFVDVMPPEGRFVLDASTRPLLLFAGGSGITPVISILKAALARTGRPAALFYANQDERSVIFRRELDALAREHAGRARIIHHLDEAAGHPGPQHVLPLLAEAPEAEAYLCGPGPFMDMVENALLGAGLPAERVHLERFGAPPASAVAAPVEAGEAPETVAIELRGERRELPYVAGRTLLQVARDAGMDAPYSCEEGFCGCCAAQLLEGRVHMTADDALSADEKKRGLILACQSRPLTPRCAIRFVDS